MSLYPVTRYPVFGGNNDCFPRFIPFVRTDIEQRDCRQYSYQLTRYCSTNLLSRMQVHDVIYNFYKNPRLYIIIEFWLNLD